MTVFHLDFEHTGLRGRITVCLECIYKFDLFSLLFPLLYYVVFFLLNFFPFLPFVLYKENCLICVAIILDLCVHVPLHIRTFFE